MLHDFRIPSLTNSISLQNFWKAPREKKLCSLRFLLIFTSHKKFCILLRLNFAKNSLDSQRTKNNLEKNFIFIYFAQHLMIIYCKFRSFVMDIIWESKNILLYYISLNCSLNLFCWQIFTVYLEREFSNFFQWDKFFS